ncbi:hypothetical protein N7454_005974 [Penicillium verhagenii]|nr:hypothetical protein N7454_005974 [Penicillium verhagenii]
MTRKVRLYLIGILSLGYLAVIFGVMNAIYQIAFTSEKDGDDWILFWATAQFNVGILAACIPSLKPLVSRVLKLSEYSNSYPRTRSRNVYGSRSRSWSRRALPRIPEEVFPTVGGTGGNRIWSIHRGDQYALQELGSRDSGDRAHDHDPNGEYIATIGFDDEWPLAGENQQQPFHGGKDGIVKTTEVIVNKS